VQNLLTNSHQRLKRINYRLHLGRVINLSLSPLWIFGVILLRIVNLVKPVQLGGINAGRLGHLVMDTEMFLAEREVGCPGYRMNSVNLRYVWTAGLPVCNQLILDLWHSQFRFGPRWILQPVDTWNRKIPRGNATQTPWRKGPNILNQHNDLYGALMRTEPHLPITNVHFQQAERVLAHIRPDFDINKPYVCIHIRDASYFEHYQPQNREDATRDAEISDYELALRFLVASSVQVVRMGAISNLPLTFRDDLVWDYACDGSRSELLDIVLPARCSFFISTLSGPDKLAQLFRRPVLFTNLAPLKSLSLWMENSLIAPKRLRYQNGCYLTWSEIFSHNLFTLKQRELTARGIELVPNSPQELRLAVEEMTLRLNGEKIDSCKVDCEWQRLIDLIPSYLKAGGVRARIVEEFIPDQPE